MENDDPKGKTPAVSASISNTRQRFFVANTPYPDTPQVVCYHDTWTQHIPAERHRADLQELATGTLATPIGVYEGTTNPGYVAFVGQSTENQETNSPFVVFVDPTADPPAVASMGRRRDFKQLTRHKRVWPRREDE